MFNPRPKQQEVLAYTGGFMGVSAVPGSGKTHTLSRLAADLIASNALADDQEILVVTLVNSAVDNFSSRIAAFMKEYGLLPELGYRIRTLHGLAHDIVRERPELAGLSDRFTIVDERETNEILGNAVRGWLRSHPDFYDTWTDPETNLDANPHLYQKWEEGLISLAGNFISQAKDLQATPQILTDSLDKAKIRHPLLDFGLDIYISYQQALAYRSAVDFSDLIRLALKVLQSDPEFLTRLRRRWPYILEDEAQDSSLLQEEILSLLAGDGGNWVRVGDPNQAIYETFTTASPEHLRRFMNRSDVIARDLPDSGRSQPGIIRMANELIRWTIENHPVEDLRSALTPPFIRPTLPGDPQPNPPDDPKEIFLWDEKFTPEREVEVIVKSLKKWLPQNQDKTVAVLAPRNERGLKMVAALRSAGIEPVELLQSSISTRQTAGMISKVLQMLAKPADQHRIAGLFKAVYQVQLETPETQEIYQTAHELLSRNKRLEDYLWPRRGAIWLEDLAADGMDVEVINILENYQRQVRRWHQAVLLPIDQLILTISQDLFTEPARLALSYKIALMLERTAQTHPDWRLAQFVEELELIVRNERRLIGFSEEDTGFDPDQYKGQVVVATIHKAKGLEWDRVYLLSVNNYDFPSAQEYDQYIGEKYYLRGRLNLQAEALSALKGILSGDPTAMYIPEGEATLQARIEYCSERLRLFYVGITRARRSLVITWNTGRSNTQGRENQAALPFVHLASYWKEAQNENSR
ncbi:MAG: ATP-dependent helicase [Bellilinea sp.]